MEKEKEIINKKIKKHPRKEKNQKKNLNFNSKMNKSNVYYNNKPDFDLLAIKYPDLSPFVFFGPNGVSTIDWNDPKALAELNKALLANDFGVEYWSIPDGYLCPTIPSRVNYISWINDILKKKNLSDKKISGLDIGTGSSLIYPLLGYKLYGWNFVGTDIDDGALQNCKVIIEKNKLDDYITVRNSKNKIFEGVLEQNDYFEFSMCNPPYFSNLQEKAAVPGKNLIAREHELVTKGGEENFLKIMIRESITARDRIGFFTSLVGKKSTLKVLEEEIKLINKLLSKDEPGGYLKTETTTFYQGKTLRWGYMWEYILKEENLEDDRT